MELRKKTIIITGAGGGVGEGIARVCHREGANVVIADIREDAARKVAGSLKGRSLAVRCDVRVDADLKALVAASVKKFKRIDGLVNNAGVNFAKPFFETTEEDWDHVMSVDLKPAFFLTQYVTRQMLKQRPLGGSVVMISSVHSMACMPGAGPYDAAKWGVVGLGKSIALELATRNVRVNAISPGLIDTQIWKQILADAPSRKACLDHWRAQIPIGRVIAPDEIGELAAFLLSDRSACITGANIMADGGMTTQLTSKQPYEAKVVEGR